MELLRPRALPASAQVNSQRRDPPGCDNLRQSGIEILAISAAVMLEGMQEDDGRRFSFGAVGSAVHSVNGKAVRGLEGYFFFHRFRCGLKGDGRERHRGRRKDAGRVGGRETSTEEGCPRRDTPTGSRWLSGSQEERDGASQPTASLHKELLDINR